LDRELRASSDDISLFRSRPDSPHDQPPRPVEPREVEPPADRRHDATDPQGADPKVDHCAFEWLTVVIADDPTNLS